MREVYELIGEFQKHFREYIASKLDAETLRIEQERRRDFGKRDNLELSSFKRLVLSNKSAFQSDFGKKANNLPTWLDDLREIRNRVAHYEEVSREDSDEAVRLIRKISGFANLSTSYLDGKRVKSHVDDKEIKGTSSALEVMRNSELDGLIAEFPILILKRTQHEYRIYKEGIGPGSIWIAKQRDGYRIVTTGATNSLKSDIERLSGKSARTMQDRSHLWWKGLTLDEVRGVFNALAKL